MGVWVWVVGTSPRKALNIAVLIGKQITEVNLGSSSDCTSYLPVNSCNPVLELTRWPQRDRLIKLLFAIVYTCNLQHYCKGTQAHTSEKHTKFECCCYIWEIYHCLGGKKKQAKQNSHMSLAKDTQ